jgi:hypothetical protein
MAGKTWKAVIALIVVQAWGSPTLSAEPVGCEAAPGGVVGLAPTITAGFVGKQIWTVGQYEQLQITKVISKGGAAVSELRVGQDLVTITTSREGTSVTRGGRTLTVSTESMEALQVLLAASPAVFAAKEMLSARESTSALKAPEMSLLTSAAFVASLTGDTHAPLRLADRFMARHRGLYRSVVARGDDAEASCWSNYTNEVNASWNDLQSCMAETADDGWLVGAALRVACNAIWLLRSDSAWFEYLNCLGPARIAKIE